VAGGADGADADAKNLSVVEVYDPATDQWSSLPPLSVPRRGLSLVAVDKTLYAIGGNDGQTQLGAVAALDLTKVKER
jgi:hypothetical protein